MSEAAETYEFGNFPRRKLPFSVSRRELLSTLLSEFNVYSGQVEGGVARKLADLGDLADDQLSMLIPCVVKGCEIMIDEGFVCGLPPANEKPVRLFPMKSPALAGFNLFNGMITMEDASLIFAQQANWEIPRSFAYLRGLFLWLVWVGVCQPKGY